VQPDLAQLLIGDAMGIGHTNVERQP
jgi:hypothetical protein